MPLILRNRDFGLLWLSQVFSQAGTRMYQIAIMWWILQNYTEHEGTAIATFLVIAAIPPIIFAKVIGTIIDRKSSKVVLVAADLCAGACVAFIAYLLSQKWELLSILYVSSFVLSVCESFLNPTLNKAVPELVAPEDVEPAISFETATQSVANFSGAVLGALLIGQIGIVGVIWVNAASYVAAAACSMLAQFRYAKPHVPTSSEDTSVKKHAFWDAMKNQPFILALLAVFGLMNFFANPIVIVLPVYVKRLLSADATVLGILEASLWVGLIIGAFLASKIKIKSDHILLFGFICLASFGAALLIPAAYIHQELMMLALLVAGILTGMNNVKFINFFQEKVASEIKGRFFSTMQALLSFSFPIAYFAFGSLLDIYAANYVLMIQGCGIFCTAFLILALQTKQPKPKGVLS